VATVVLIMGILFAFFERQIETELANTANYLSQAVENNGVQFFDNFEAGNNRITLIADDGNVLFDSSADKEQLDNHSKREEIIEARETGKGTSVRYSNTLTEKTVYYAVKLSNNCILRISTKQYTVFTILLSLVQPLLIILAIALVLTIILSSRVSQAIVKPINELDLDYPEKNETYEELAPLMKKISAQKKTINEQLKDARKKQEEFTLITENMSEGFLLIDKNTNLLTYNSAALRLLGIEDAPLGSVLLLCRTKDFRELIEQVLSGEKAKNTMEKFECKYELIANPVLEKESVIGAVIIIIDVTEREKNEALRREFTANVSHELKTPLTSISGFAELMKNGGIPNETVMDFSNTIYNEAQRLVSLVNDIIKISELDEKSISIESENVDLYELSGEILNRLKNEAAKKNVTMNLIGDTAKIFGIRKILNEMIYNLCDNAIKYNKDNGTVDVILSSGDKKVSITVRDTGIGIPIMYQQRVFERFFRVDKGHSKKVGGTGLGLAIVKHGALYHNAEIELNSVEEKGTSVKIIFDKI
jgi:two-component system phosphate regulon sensor histidine kinase PhoR